MVPEERVVEDPSENSSCAVDSDRCGGRELYLVETLSDWRQGTNEIGVAIYSESRRGKWRSVRELALPVVHASRVSRDAALVIPSYAPPPRFRHCLPF